MALFELLRALRAGDGTDLVHDFVRLVLEELVQAGASSVIGVGHSAVSDSRVRTRWTECGKSPDSKDL